MENKVRAKKRYGQNFLQDWEILKLIVDSNDLTPQDTVLEIGLGTGILTEALAATGCNVIGVEIDYDLIPVLQKKFEHKENVTVLIGDFLKMAEGIFNDLENSVKVVANIPYYITTPILEKLLNYKNKIAGITLMMQKEVADRLMAGPSTKDYGSLTIFISYFTEVSKICDVPKTAFRPVPKVDSAVLQLKMRSQPLYPVVSEKRFFNITRGAFWARRKTLRNTLKQSPFTHYSQDMLNKMETETGIDLNRRGETLTIQEFAELANVVFN